MNIIDQINQMTNSFYDADKLIEYLFVGWDRILPADEKRELIRKHGKPRSNPMGVVFENKVVVISNPYPQVERQMIYREQLEKETT